MAIVKKLSQMADLFQVTNPSAIVTTDDVTLFDKTSTAVRTAKDCRIVRQGIVQAVLQSPALIAYCTDLPSYERMVKELAENFVKWVWEE